MQKITLLLTLFYSAWFPAIAQNASITNSNGSVTGQSSFGTIPLTGNIQAGNASKFKRNLSFNGFQNKFNDFRDNGSPSVLRVQQSNSADLRKGKQFDPNIYDGSYPSDNTAAVSKEGYIVSIVNSNITFSDTAGNILQTNTITAFINDTTLKDVIYEPDLIYDPVAGRFCFVEAYGTNSLTACLLLFVSKTGNPLDGWFYHKIPISKDAPGESADLPKLGVSDSSIYITANLFTSNENFDQSVIYQVDKNSALQGTLKYLFWNNILDNQSNPPYSLAPASFGGNGNYGHGFYFVSISDGSGGDRLQVFYITNNINYSPQVIAFHVGVNDFAIGTPAAQPDNSPRLDMGDCRIKKAFYLNGIIHCVLTAAINASGYNGIMYARINAGNMTATTQQFGLGDRDITYPSLAWAGTSENDKSVVIFYEESGISIYPGTEAIICDDAMNFGDPIPVKQGVSYIKIDANAIERWGDYSSICRDWSNASSSFWGFGTYGTSAHTYGNNICRLWNLSVFDSTGSNNKLMTVYPNPFSGKFTIRINNSEPVDASFDLFDSVGRLVKHLADNHMGTGMYKYDFTEKIFAPGLYFLVLSSGKRIISNEKVVVQ